MKIKQIFKFIGLLGLGLTLIGCIQQTKEMDVGCKRIAFVLSNAAGQEIYSICPDGSGLTNLTNSDADDYSPAWSPDGKRLAFVSTRTGSSQVFLMQEDGKTQTLLTSDYQNDDPVWLPDGKQIAVRTTDGNGLWWWRLFDLDDENISDLTEPSYDFFFQKQAWSPDGKKIAYMSLQEQVERNDGSSQIHIMNMDGSEDQALTSDIWANISPAWSPDGEWIAFLSERDGTYNSFALYIIRADGRKLKRLTEPVYSESAVFSWSPDGTQIAIADLFHVEGISIVEVKNRKVTLLPGLTEKGSGLSPSWQP